MNAITLPFHANGRKPHLQTPPAPARVVPLLGTKVNQLCELRALLRKSQEAERELTREILTAMEAAGVRELRGTEAVARLEPRTTLAVDVALFLEAVGTRGYAALTVGITAARRVMAADDLEAIAEKTTTAALRVEPIKDEPGPAPAA